MERTYQLLRHAVRAPEYLPHATQQVIPVIGLLNESETFIKKEISVNIPYAVSAGKQYAGISVFHLNLLRYLATPVYGHDYVEQHQIDFVLVLLKLGKYEISEEYT
ncbi:MAG: hypothetical protein VCC01_12190 [Candidatus Hydrogenedentota bacterium]